MVNTFGTGAVEDSKLVEIIRENFDLRPAGIIKMLDLRRPIYAQTAAYGHFGRTDIDLPWEKTDKAEELKKVSCIRWQDTAIRKVFILYEDEHLLVVKKAFLAWNHSVEKSFAMDQEKSSSRLFVLKNKDR